VAVPDSRVQRAYRTRVALFLLAVILTMVVLVVGHQGIQTLRALDVVERDRDRWQQAGEVIEQLNLKDGSVAADVGSGAGYFALKLAPRVGEKGGILAVDILKEPLVFLWIRALLRHQSNVHIIHGDPDNPHLPDGQIDAVLVANAYHEFMHPRAVLNHVFQALHAGGRLVIVDRGPLPDDEESHEFEARSHEVLPSAVEGELRETGFEVISRHDRFIDRLSVERPGDRPDHHPWWLIVARKP
jgi:ubiquinone/menaquinone biosynthesis C-methylase UbiE